MAKAKVVTSVRPMLASRGTWKDKVGDENWIAEEKFDGSRYLAFLTRSGPRIISRRGIEKTDRLPQLVADLNLLVSLDDGPGVGTVLDGEVVAGTFSETISLVNSLGSRGVDSRTPYRYMVFDILRKGKEDLRTEIFADRRHELDDIFEYSIGVHDTKFNALELTPQVDSTEIPAFLEKIWGAGGEGLILKHVGGVYQEGKRAKSWIKVKAVETADGVITGFTPGEGKYQDTIGAIVIGQYREGNLVNITKISGMTDELRYRLGSNKQEFVGKVVEFAYQNKTDKSYRHPRFKRFRPDKDPVECNWNE